MADFSTDTLITSIIKAVLIVVFLLLSVLIAIWFERKVIGRMQERPGPNVHGPFGLLQSLFDAMKLLIKEDITVKAADKVVYILAPMISVFVRYSSSRSSRSDQKYASPSPTSSPHCNSLTSLLPRCISLRVHPWGSTALSLVAGPPAPPTRCLDPCDPPHK